MKGWTGCVGVQTSADIVDFCVFRIRCRLSESMTPRFSVFVVVLALGGISLMIRLNKIYFIHVSTNFSLPNYLIQAKKIAPLYTKEINL